MKKRKTCTLCLKKDSFKIKYVLHDFNIVQCSNCKLLARDVIFTKKEIEDLYSKDYFCKLQKDYFSAGISQELESSLRVKDFNDRLRKISIRTKLNKGKLIDIGCATGVFLKIAKDKGWNPFGVEVSKYAAKFAIENYHLKVFCGELKDSKLKNNSFDVATGWDVIEHVEDPTSLVQDVKRILKPKGYFVLQTTMTDSLLFLVADIIYKLTFGKISILVRIAYPVHHSNHFSRDTLKKLLQRNGFKVTAQENVEWFWEETSLPKIFLPFLKIFAIFSRLTGRTIESFIIGQKL